MEPSDKEIKVRLLLSAFERLSKFFRFLWREHSSQLGLTPIQAEILQRVCKFPNKFNTIGGLAKNINVTPGTVSESVNALEQKGLVKRVRSKSDRRVQVVVPTVRGKGIGKNIDKLYEDFTSILFNLSDEELSEGLRFLGGFIRVLQENGILPLDSVCEECPYLRKKAGVSKHKHVCSFTYLAESWGYFCMHFNDEQGASIKQEVTT